MKKKWSKARKKNALIGFLIFTNFASGSYILANETHFQPFLKTLHHQKRASAAVASARSPAARLGSVQPAFFKNDDKMRECYQSYLAKRPHVDEGSVLVHWKYNRKGQVESLKLVHTDIKDERFTDCVLERIRHAKMPAMKAGTVVAHRFNFRRITPSHLEF